MFLLIAASTALTAPDSTPRKLVAVTVEARATVRILSGARVRMGDRPDGALPKLRQAQIRTADGQRPAQLIEFE